MSRIAGPERPRCVQSVLPEQEKIRFPDAVESVTVVGTVTPDSCLIQ